MNWTGTAPLRGIELHLHDNDTEIYKESDGFIFGDNWIQLLGFVGIGVISVGSIIFYYLKKKNALAAVAQHHDTRYTGHRGLDSLINNIARVAHGDGGSANRTTADTGEHLATTPSAPVISSLGSEPQPLTEQSLLDSDNYKTEFSHNVLPPSYDQSHRYAAGV